MSGSSLGNKGWTLIQIELTRGFVTLIDDEDAHLVTPHKWYSHLSGGINYAERRPSHAGPILKLHNVLLRPPTGFIVDHADGDGLNNRRSNLRLASALDNGRNKKKRDGTTSPYKGVSWNTQKRRWVGRIYINGKHLHLGYFFDAVEAANAYDFIAAQCFGPFARLNFPEVAA